MHGWDSFLQGRHLWSSWADNVQLPVEITTSSGFLVASVPALCLYLKRYAYPKLVPTVSQPYTPKKAREERPWVRLVTCLGGKFIFMVGVQFIRLLSPLLFVTYKTGSLCDHGKPLFSPPLGCRDEKTCVRGCAYPCRYGDLALILRGWPMSRDIIGFHGSWIKKSKLLLGKLRTNRERVILPSS